MPTYLKTNNNIVLNFSKSYIKTRHQLLESPAFKDLLETYIKKEMDLNNLAVTTLNDISDDLITDLINIFKLLIAFELSDIKSVNEKYEKLIENKESLHQFVEGFYDYWREFERYAFVKSRRNTSGIENVNFLEETNKFNDLILHTYRSILSKLLSSKLNVFRQLQAGINAALVVQSPTYKFDNLYEKLNGINQINQVILRAPFISYTKKNTRTGLFEESEINPLKKINIDSKEWFCYPALVGKELIYVYFNYRFMNHGISLANLFELATGSDLNKKPSGVYIFGDSEAVFKKPHFFIDKTEELLVAYCPFDEEYDYFGYMKKMLLTMHNVIAINKSELPIHGAMVKITLKNKVTKNICIVGDSGAGKSESLEAFRLIAKDYLSKMEVIFDDMGVFKLEDGLLKAYGTEIGAFVRLDDLDNGYAYKQIDRAIFLNPHKVNARLLLPISDYKTITKGYAVDFFLYANNYEDSKEEIILFDDYKNFENSFIKAKRKAKGTTTEEGIVESFFANPFGPVQYQEKTTKIIKDYFNHMTATNVNMGTMCTKLAIDNMEMSGPKAAATRLLELILEK